MELWILKKMLRKSSEMGQAEKSTGQAFGN